MHVCMDVFACVWAHIRVYAFMWRPSVDVKNNRIIPTDLHLNH